LRERKPGTTVQNDALVSSEPSLREYTKPLGRERSKPLVEFGASA
jgi:hypothetical protein